MRNRFLIASVSVGAVVTACIGIWRAYADEGFSDEISVNIASLGTNDVLTIYTPDREVQDEMPLRVRTLVGREPIAFGQPLSPALAADVSIGGTVEVEGGVPQISDPIDSVPAELTDFSATGSSYLSVIDLSVLDYTETNIGSGLTGLVGASTLRALVVADSYYVKGAITTEVAEEPVDITLLDAALVDTDENGVPDATALLEPFTLMMGPNGNITYAVDLGDLDRGTESFDGFISFGLRTQDGPVEVSVDAPTMNQLAAANAAYNLYAGRLIVSVANDPRDLVDLPLNVDPEGDFDIPNDEPQGIFIRTLIALTDAVDLRGGVPQWTFLDELPGSLSIVVEVSGPGVINQLQDGDTGFGYIYRTQTVQSGENILVERTGGWAPADFFDVANLHNGDDFARGNAPVDEGDDTLLFETQTSSGIFASNLMPELRGGGGGGGGRCFIATAAYGTPMAAEIQSLRDVRDAYLIDTALGAAFVDAYYRVSPPIARVVSESPAVKAVVRAVLAPVVTVSRWTMAAPGAVAAAGLVLVLMIAVGLRRMHRA